MQGETAKSIPRFHFQMIDLAIIPVAGRGTALLPLTKSQPKEMLSVGRKPVVQYVVEELVHCGINNLLFVTGSGKTAIENHFDANEELIRHLRLSGKEDSLAELAFERQEARYFYVRQRHLLGLGHAVLCAEPFVKGHRFVVALGDTILGLHHKAETLRRMIRIFEQQADSVKAVIAFDQVAEDEVVNYGIAAVKKSGRDSFELDDLVEKPEKHLAPSRLAVAARYVFAPDIFEYLRKIKPGIHGEIQLTDAIRLLIQSGKKVLGVRLTPQESRYDIGTFESYYRAFLDAVKGDPVYGTSFQSF